MTSVFKVGQTLRATARCDRRTLDHIAENGGNSEALVVRSIDEDGDPIFTYERDLVYSGYAASYVLFEVVQEENEQFIINTFDTNRTFASQEDAETYLKDNTPAGDSFTISKVVRQGKIANSLVDAQ